MSSGPSSKIIPNTFQTPNLLVDEGLMVLLTGSELKCYIVVIRKTFGWRKDRDRIAKSQIMAATGLSEGTVDECMISLVKFGLVIRTAENNAANEGVEWAPQMDDSQIKLEALLNRHAEARAANSKRTQKARLARGGDVQHTPPVQQPQGGDVGHPPQQPYTANKDHEEEGHTQKFSMSAELQKTLQEHGVYVSCFGDVDLRLTKGGWTEDDVRAVIAWQVKTRKTKAQVGSGIVTRIREGSKAAKEYYLRPVATVGDDEPTETNEILHSLVQDETITDTVRLAWGLAVEQLRADMSKRDFEEYVVDTEPVHFEPGLMHVGCTSETDADWLNDRIRRSAEQALLGVMNEHVKLIFVVASVAMETEG